MFKEFKEFALKGNLIDMAVAFVMGAAFIKLSTAFIEGLVMPLVAKIGGGADFSNSFIPLYSKAVETVTENGAKVEKVIPLDSIKTLADAKKYGPVFAWGDFVTVAINFIIVALVMFLVVKAINRAKALATKQETAAPAAPPPQEVLLAEIRDLLKQQSGR